MIKRSSELFLHSLHYSQVIRLLHCLFSFLRYANMMTQRQYSILYWVTLVMGLVATTLGRDIVGVVLYLISCIFMVAGDFALRLEKFSGDPKE